MSFPDECLPFWGARRCRRRPPSPTVESVGPPAGGPGSPCWWLGCAQASRRPRAPRSAGHGGRCPPHPHPHPQHPGGPKGRRRDLRPAGPGSAVGPTGLVVSRPASSCSSHRPSPELPGPRVQVCWPRWPLLARARPWAGDPRQHVNRRIADGRADEAPAGTGTEGGRGRLGAESNRETALQGPGPSRPAWEQLSYPAAGAGGPRGVGPASPASRELSAFAPSVLRRGDGTQVSISDPVAAAQSVGGPLGRGGHRGPLRPVPAGRLHLLCLLFCWLLTGHRAAAVAPRSGCSRSQVGVSQPRRWERVATGASLCPGPSRGAHNGTLVVLRGLQHREGGERPVWTAQLYR